MQLKIRFACIPILLGCLASISTSLFAAQADLTNSWTSTIGGNWESLNWSMGGFPGTNQAILFTNANSKVVSIGTNTTLTFPQTLHVGSLTIASPADTQNELLMNGVGTATPLIIGDGDLSSGNSTGSLVIGTNSSFVTLNSSLIVQNNIMGAELGAFSVGGTFDEGDGSHVMAATFLHVGDIGPGAYNMTNSSLYVGNYETVGGFPSAFNQYGGTNLTVSLTLTNSGAYNLYAGTLAFTNGAWHQQSWSGMPVAEIVFQGGTFNQWGGNVSTMFNFVGPNSSYNLYGGNLSSSNITLDVGGIWQSGGTNTATTLFLQGSNPSSRGNGYNLSGGVLNSGAVYIGIWTGEGPGPIVGYTFNQSGGYHSTGALTISGSPSYNGNYYGGHYAMSGGTLAVNGVLALNIGSFSQSDGTNLAGTISLSAHSSWNLSGGWLAAQNLQLADAFVQSGGTNQTGNLSVYDSSGNYTLQGGALEVGSIEVTGGGIFQHTGGTCALSGLLTLDNGTWQERANGQALGQLQLGPGGNSGITLPAGGCELQFSDSSGLNWAEAGVLHIMNWNGSRLGGGIHRIIFGNTIHGLTAQQLAQVQFVNPVGLSAGSYPASILASGEIVPYVTPTNVLTQTNTAPAPFFNGEAGLGSDWYYLPLNSGLMFGYYSLANYPFVYHLDMGWEYFVDAGNGQGGAYFYDFTDDAFFYTDPATFPYLYDFNLNTWVFYAPQSGSTDRYTSNPRWFFDFNMQTWVNNL